MTKSFKKVVALTATAALASSTLIPAAVAADTESMKIAEVIYVKDGQNLKLSINDYQQAVAVGALKSGGMEYIKATDGNYYLLSDYQQALAVNKGEMAEALKVLAEAELQVDLTNIEQGEIQNGEVVGDKEVEQKEIKVESVKAINQTVNKGATIEFQINEKDENITVADLPEGYTANFKASKEVFKETKTTSTTGELKGEFEGKFTYEVEILKDGKVVHTSERAEVTVEDQSEIITEFDIVTDKNTLVGEEVASIKVMGKTKDMAKDADLVNLTDKAEISLAPTALATGALNENNDAYEVKGKAGRKGEVTVTVKVEGLEDKTVKLQIANEERKVDASQSTISTEAVKVATEATETFTVELKDQYGDALTNQTVTVDGFDGAKANAAEDEEKPGTYTVTVTGGDKAAKGDFTVKVGETEIGKVAVEVQEAGEVATWELTSDVEEVDIATAEDNKATVTLTVVAKDDKGLTVKDHGKTLVVKYGDTEVDVNDGKATFNDIDLTDAKKGDTLEFELFEKNGALTDALDVKATVTVIDTTPTLDSVEFNKEVTEVKVGDDFADLVTAKATTAEGKEAEVTVEYKDENTLEIKSGNFALGTVDVQGATVNEEGTVATTTADKVTLTHFTPEGEYVSEAQYDVFTIVKLTEAKFAEGSDLVEGDAATKATATVGGVKFEAAEAGEISDADAITIKIVQGEASAEKPTVDASAELNDKTLTITLGATWAGEEEESKASTPTDLKANQVQGLLDAANITAVKVADGAGEAPVTVATGELKGGTDKGDDTPAKSATVTFTFTEAVELDGDFSFFVKGEGEAAEVKATAAEVTEEGKNVVATLATDSTVKATDVITDIKGLKTVKKGEIKIDENGVNITDSE